MPCDCPGVESGAVCAWLSAGKTLSNMKLAVIASCFGMRFIGCPFLELGFRVPTYNPAPVRMSRYRPPLLIMVLDYLFATGNLLALCPAAKRHPSAVEHSSLHYPISQSPPAHPRWEPNPNSEQSTII